MDLGLEGKAFVVTAASSGLGLATARALVAEGARVTLVARRQAVLGELADELGAATLSGDLAEPDLLERAADLTVDRFGTLDGVFASAGGPPPGKVLDISDEQWRDSFERVFLPPLHAAKALFSRNPTGRLGLVLSTSALSPLASMAISNGLRPGLAMLVKQLADEVGPQGGRVFAMLPGKIATERMDQLFGHTGDPAAARAAAEAEIPARRLGEPEEFGRMAAFLLGDGASYVSGSLVAVDGGSLRAL